MLIPNARAFRQIFLADILKIYNALGIAFDIIVFKKVAL